MAGEVIHVHAFPDDEPVVSMIDYRGMIIIATTKRIYRLHPKEMVVRPIAMELKE